MLVWLARPTRSTYAMTRVSAAVFNLATVIPVTTIQSTFDAIRGPFRPSSARVAGCTMIITLATLGNLDNTFRDPQRDSTIVVYNRTHTALYH